MKRIILFICTLFFVQTLSAQVSRDILERNTNTNVRLAIKDAKTAEPISWVSVYLVPVGDTTINTYVNYLYFCPDYICSCYCHVALFV